TSLNPVLSIGRQITETVEQHRGVDRAAAHRRAIELLGLVGLADPERRLKQYPHELSGGMRQRVMIAIAIACDPKLIIADEPTTGAPLARPSAPFLLNAPVIQSRDSVKESNVAGSVVKCLQIASDGHVTPPPA